MATPYEIRQLQRAINSFNTRYALGQPHVAVDSAYGALTARESKWDQWVLGFRTDQIGGWPILTVTNWLFHPSLYFAGHPGGYLRHRSRLASLRTPAAADGLMDFDGAQIAAWIHPILIEARQRGWGGTVPDKTYGGFRTYAQQAELYREYLGGGGIAAPPGTSRHEEKDWDGGAVDCSYNDQLDGILSNLGSDLGRQGGAPNIDPVHFSSRHKFDRTGQF